MKSFFRMRRSEWWFLTLLILFVGVGFLPWWRDVHLAGISLFGLWMATLMILSPLGALLIFVFDRRRSGQGT